jgi:hypothetical protein
MGANAARTASDGARIPVGLIGVLQSWEGVVLDVILRAAQNEVFLDSCIHFA